MATLRALRRLWRNFRSALSVRWSPTANNSPSRKEPRMIRRQIAVLNRSTVATDAEVERVMKAVEKQANYHYSESWGMGAVMTFLPKDVTTGWQGKWNIVVSDTSDEANALGYHDLTPDGLPLGKVFWKTTLLDKALPSVAFSHETLEMLGDPYINQSASVYLKTGGMRIYAYEN